MTDTGRVKLSQLVDKISEQLLHFQELKEKYAHNEWIPDGIL